MSRDNSSGFRLLGNRVLLIDLYVTSTAPVWAWVLVSQGHLVTNCWVTYCQLQSHWERIWCSCAAVVILLLPLLPFRYVVVNINMFLTTYRSEKSKSDAILKSNHTFTIIGKTYCSLTFYKQDLHATEVEVFGISQWASWIVFSHRLQA